MTCIILSASALNTCTNGHLKLNDMRIMVSIIRIVTKNETCIIVKGLVNLILHAICLECTVMDLVLFHNKSVPCLPCWR